MTLPDKFQYSGSPTEKAALRGQMLPPLEQVFVVDFPVDNMTQNFTWTPWDKKNFLHAKLGAAAGKGMINEPGFWEKVSPDRQQGLDWSYLTVAYCGYDPERTVWRIYWGKSIEQRRTRTSSSVLFLPAEELPYKSTFEQAIRTMASLEAAALFRQPSLEKDFKNISRTRGTGISCPHWMTVAETYGINFDQALTAGSRSTSVFSGEPVLEGK